MMFPLAEEIFACADSGLPEKIIFVWGDGIDQPARQSSASLRATSAFGEAPTIVQSALDSWGWTTGVPDGVTGADYEVVEGVIQVKTI